MKIFGSQKFLAVYSGFLTLVVTCVALGGFASPGRHATFDTITVERIDVVEPDGTLRMVITNNSRIPGIVLHGHEYADYGGRKATTAAGILFYDAQATESGGLTYGGRRDADGNISRFGHLSFDRYDQDQMFTIDAADDGTNHASSVTMLDQPSWSIEEYLRLLDTIQDLPPDEQEARIDEFLETHPLGAVRTVLASENYPDLPSASQNALHIRDAAGQERTRLGVDADGRPTLEFRDQAGITTHVYPPAD
ncbi:MAG TPA: hypothetical protein VEL05_10010 [Candidatus Acidoferrum sp.]|nr:hypothetical protein [Candidatus Acidoferrum sp.]